jgi:hypothetical protein
MPTETRRWKPGPLDALLSAWTFEITQALLPTTPDVWRQNSPFPIVTVIGPDDPSGAFSYLYADGRGVRRVYQMTLADGVWKIRGQAEPRFFQRLQGTLATTARPSPAIGNAPRTASAGTATSTSDTRRLGPHE